MLQRLYNLLHPRRKPFGPIPLGVLILAVVLALIVGFVSGWGARTVYDRKYFESHYTFPGLRVPELQVPLTERPKALPPQASINLAYYPSPGDQGQIGACAAWATAWAASYAWRTTHAHSWLRFSPRQMYDHFADTYNGGQDAGSWPDQDIEIATTTGLLQFKALPEPPYQIDNPIPAIDAWGHDTATDAAKHRFSFSLTQIGGYATGQGQGLVDGIKAAIAAGHPVLIGFPVWPEYDNATVQPLVTAPTPLEVQQQPNGRGGHENVILAYDDALRFPDGTVGGVLVQNQWSTAWGQQGRAWLSYDFVRQWVFGAEWLQLGAQTGGIAMPPEYRDGVPAQMRPTGSHTYAPPQHGPVTSAPRPKAGGILQMRNLVTKDTGQNISDLVNYWANYYGLSPLGVAAMIGTESDFTANPGHYSIENGANCDLSGGLTQVTVCTAGGYGVGNGSQTYSNIQYVYDWETVPGNAIYLGSRVLYDDKRAVCYDFWQLYAAYNEGSAWGCFAPEYSNPSNWITQQAVRNFRAWEATLDTPQYVYYAQPPPPPKPPTFPLKSWCAFASKHHTHCISSTWHRKRRYEAALWWRGHVRSAGAIVSKPQYFRRRHHSFVTTRFQYERLYWWLGQHWVKWIKVRPIT